MKTPLFFLALLILSTLAEARDVYGVRGPRGAAVVGNDRAVAVTRRGVAATGPNGTYVARRPVGYAARPVVVAPRRVVVAPLPRGYVRTIPGGYRRVYYGGYHCYYVGGVYYRTVFYEGDTVYVIVR